MKATILFLFTLLFACHTQAQNIRGQVSDSLTHEPLVGATVTLHRGMETSFLDYAITDAEGRFAFKRSEAKGLNISVTYLGYRKKMTPATGGEGYAYRTPSRCHYPKRSDHQERTNLSTTRHGEIRPCPICIEQGQQYQGGIEETPRHRCG